MRLATAAILSLLTASSANASCFLGGSIGANVSTPTIDAGILNLGVSTRTALVAPEIGCDHDFGGVSLGALARYNVAPYTSGSVATFDEVKSSGSYSLLGKVGFKVNDAAILYGVAGISGKQFTFNTVGTSATGTTLGAGLELAIAKTDWAVFAEADVTTYANKLVSGLSVKPNDNVFRVGARWRPSFAN